MRKHFLLALAIGAFATSCQKHDANTNTTASDVSTETLVKIKNAGFGTDNVRKVDNGYLVEGDIVLTNEYLNGSNSAQLLRVADVEQYRTTNLVSSPRTITIKVSNLGTAYVSGTDTAIARYNALGLGLTFSRITTGTASITITGFNQAASGGYITLGSSGFPTSAGAPYSSILMNTNSAAYGSSPNVQYVGSVIQHEIGHCIGFRHTDYANRSYSCGGSAVNEGASTVGAIWIPGTPTGNDANSWMLACSNGGNRTFNANDVIALNYLY